MKGPLLCEPDKGMGSNKMVKVKKLLTNVEDETAELKDEQNVTNSTFVFPKRVNFDDEENDKLNPLVEFDFLVA